MSCRSSSSWVCEGMVSQQHGQEKAAQVWRWLRENGFNHLNALSVLAVFEEYGGERHFYREMMAVADRGELQDPVKARFLRLVQRAFKGMAATKGHAQDSDDDARIRDFYWHNLSQPSGPLAFKAALEAIPIVFDSEDYFRLIDALTAPHVGTLISREDVLRQKMALGFVADGAGRFGPIVYELAAVSERACVPLMKEFEDAISEVVISRLAQANPAVADILMQGEQAQLRQLLAHYGRVKDRQAPDLLFSHAVSVGAADIRDYFLQYAEGSGDIVKIVAVMNQVVFLHSIASHAEQTLTWTLDRYLASPVIRQCLVQALHNPSHFPPSLVATVQRLLAADE